LIEQRKWNRYQAVISWARLPSPVRVTGREVESVVEDADSAEATIFFREKGREVSQGTGVSDRRAVETCTAQTSEVEGVIIVG